MKVPKEAYVDIIEAFTIDLWTLQMIADVVHVTKSSVRKILNKNGVDTSNKKVTVSCTVCGAPIQRTRKRARVQRNHFCNTDCYNAYLAAGKGDYVQSVSCPSCLIFIRSMLRIMKIGTT